MLVGDESASSKGPAIDERRVLGQLSSTSLPFNSLCKRIQEYMDRRSPHKAKKASDK
jgi:hypothetical protein